MELKADIIWSEVTVYDGNKSCMRINVMLSECFNIGKGKKTN